MFLIALIFGIVQVFLTERLINAVNKKYKKEIFLYFLAKFLLYGIGICLLILKHIWQFATAISGFTVGVPITAIALFVYNTMYKKQK